MPERLSITSIPGIYAAHDTLEEGGSGCTLICCPAGAIGGVDVRGGAPATRETDLLRPEETVDVVHAVVLSGGSAFGLAAASGVAEELERRGVGLDVGVTKVPIVASACLFDLACGSAHVRPDAASGVRATIRALEGTQKPLERGNVGAGTACTVGKIAGPGRAMKAGFGEALIQQGELLVGAVAAVNAVGNIVNPLNGSFVAGTLDPHGTHVIPFEEAARSVSEQTRLLRTNTTISCVITNACLSKAQATKLAQMASDAYAHAIKPTHTTQDGDAIFVMATGEVEAELDALGMLVVAALEQAIVDGAQQASSAYGYLAASDLPSSGSMSLS